MSDLLAPILVVMENEVDAFWCFAGFIHMMVSLRTCLLHIVVCYYVLPTYRQKRQYAIGLCCWWICVLFMSQWWQEFCCLHESLTYPDRGLIFGLPCMCRELILRRTSRLWRISWCSCRFFSLLSIQNLRTISVSYCCWVFRRKTVFSCILLEKYTSLSANLDWWSKYWLHKTVNYLFLKATW